jgi:cellobiose-specific phosphotransferase system component IIB
MLKVVNATGWYPSVLVKDITVEAASGDEWLIRLTSVDNLADGKDDVEVNLMGPNGWVTDEKSVPEEVNQMVEILTVSP